MLQLICYVLGERKELQVVRFESQQSAYNAWKSIELNIAA